MEGKQNKTKSGVNAHTIVMAAERSGCFKVQMEGKISWDCMNGKSTRSEVP